MPVALAGGRERHDPAEGLGRRVGERLGRLVELLRERAKGDGLRGNEAPATGSAIAAGLPREGGLVEEDLNQPVACPPTRDDDGERGEIDDSVSARGIVSAAAGAGSSAKSACCVSDPVLRRATGASKACLGQGALRPV